MAANRMYMYAFEYAARSYDGWLRIILSSIFRPYDE